MKRLGIADLICYNAAGQRKKSLGMVLDVCVKTDTGAVRGVDVYYLIDWLVMPEIQPRAEWHDPRVKSSEYDWKPNNKTERGWFKAGPWLELLSKK